MAEVLSGIHPQEIKGTLVCPVYEETWLLYFDILGFRNMVMESIGNDYNFLRLKSLYDIVVDEITTSPVKIKDIKAEYHWFSDSFLVWSRSDKISSFPWMEFFGRQFLLKCIYYKIPVRGALAYGDFYMETNGRSFFGPALVEAYEWAEAQDWINFLLCPSVREKAKEEIQWDLGLNYSDEGIPFNSRKPHVQESPAAYTFRHVANFEHPSLSILRSLMTKAPDSAKQKYQNTISYIEKHLQPMGRKD